MNKSSLFAKALQESLSEADHLKCSLTDWSNIGGVSTLLDKTKTQSVFPIELITKPWLYAYDNYHQTIWGVVFFNLLGEKTLQSFVKLSVLDVGCGTSKQFQNMFKDVPGVSKDTLKYTSIDINPNIVRPSWVKEHCEEHHIIADVFDNDSVIALKGTYDIVIIDIEPHSKECEIYERFLPYMKQHHMIVLKCIGFRDLYGSKLAKDFISYITEVKKLRLLGKAFWEWSCRKEEYAILNVYPSDVVLIVEV